MTWKFVSSLASIHNLADTLYRASLINNESNVEDLTIEKNMKRSEWLHDLLPVRKVGLEELREESQTDGAMRRAFEKLILQADGLKTRRIFQETWPHIIKFVTSCLFKMELSSAEINVSVPRALRASVLSRIHRSHIGVEGWLKLVKKAEMAGTDPWLAILDCRNTPQRRKTTNEPSN